MLLTNTYMIEEMLIYVNMCIWKNKLVTLKFSGLGYFIQFIKFSISFSIPGLPYPVNSTNGL